MAAVEPEARNVNPPEELKKTIEKSRTSFHKSNPNGSSKTMSRLQVRRQSYGFGSIPGICPITRTSQLAIEFKRPILIYLPTYQVEPYVKFHHAKTQAVIEETLDEYFTGFKYSSQDSPYSALRIAGDIMRKVKALNFNRYRIISVVTIGQKRSQSYNNAVGFIWDGHRDGYVEVHREVTSAFIQVTVFGVYLD